MKSLRVATCQFSIEADIDHNRRCVLRQIEQAADRGAHVVHFSECALSGYAGVDIPDVDAIDWENLTASTEEVLAAARRFKLWVLLGSTHRLTGNHKPHNSVYVIDPRGQIVDRYDKRFCTGTNGKRCTMDLSHYSPGNRCVTFREGDHLRCVDLLRLPISGTLPRIQTIVRGCVVSIVSQRSFHRRCGPELQYLEDDCPRHHVLSSGGESLLDQREQQYGPPIALGELRCAAGWTNRRPPQAAQSRRVNDRYDTRPDDIRRTGSLARRGHERHTS